MTEPVEEENYSFIWEIANVKGRDVKLYKLTKWSKEKLEKAASQDQISALYRQIEILHNILNTQIINSLEAKILVVLNDRKKHRKQTVYRKIGYDEALFWEVRTGVDNLAERGVVKVESGLVWLI